MSMALVRNPGDGPVYRYYDETIEQVVSTAETDGVVTVTRLTMSRAGAPPLHTHDREDESWIVLSGRVRFWVGAASLDRCEVRDAEPGAYVFGPRLVPHTLQPITSVAEILVVNNPGAVEGYFRSVGPADSRRDADNAALLAEYGIQVLAPPPVS